MVKMYTPEGKAFDVDLNQISLFEKRGCTRNAPKQKVESKPSFVQKDPNAKLEVREKVVKNEIEDKPDWIK